MSWSQKWKEMPVNILIFDARRSPSVQIWTYPTVLWWKLYIAERLGNSQCIQGTGIDSELWFTFPGEVVKSLNSEVILGYEWINYWLFPIYCKYVYKNDFNKRFFVASGGIVPVTTLFYKPVSDVKGKTPCKAQKYWENRLRLEKHHFTDRQC